MTLREGRIAFSKLIPRLVDKAFELGYEFAFDEVANNQGVGHMPGSLHYIALACDGILYKDGVYQTDTEAYRPLGEYWESLDSHCNWGGRFAQADGNHFSYSGPDIPGCLTIHGVLRK